MAGKAVTTLGAYIVAASITGTTAALAIPALGDFVSATIGEIFHVTESVTPQQDPSTPATTIPK